MYRNVVFSLEARKDSCLGGDTVITWCFCRSLLGDKQIRETFFFIVSVVRGSGAFSWYKSQGSFLTG